MYTYMYIYIYIYGRISRHGSCATFGHQHDYHKLPEHAIQCYATFHIKGYSCLFRRKPSFWQTRPLRLPNALGSGTMLNPTMWFCA